MEEKDIRRRLQELMSRMGVSPEASIRVLQQSGSQRRYYRLSADGRTYVGTFVPDSKEGKCFIDLARVFREKGVDVPEVFSVSPDCQTYIQEDLGDVSLFSLLKTPEAEQYVRQTLLGLVVLQKTPECLWREACMHGPFGLRLAMWDLNYFKYEFLKPMEVVFDEDRLEDDFERLARHLTSISDEFQGFMMRDCQSRNVMITPRGPVFIDFQGGRRGPVLYDAVSLLWQARAGFDSDFRQRMLDFYCDAYTGGDADMKHEMLASLPDMVLFRTLQVLGAYGFRGLVQRKAHFLISIPGALDNLRDLVKIGALDGYPELKRCAESLTALPAGQDALPCPRLIIEVCSFSYKKGYPENMTGNGGGFMFDCRAMHNPGRYSEYKSLTGRDRPVVDFLEARGEVKAFLQSAWALTDPAVERYISRGFTNLQVGFGCTGGQHRSVYCAEATARHLKELFPETEVKLIHREHPE